MLSQLNLTTFPPGAGLLLLAAVIVYAVSRSMADLLQRGRTDVTPGRLAIATCVPVLAMSLFAAIYSQNAGMALGVVLGTALGSLVLVNGVALLNANVSLESAPVGAKGFQFLLPVALALLVLGFGARIGLTEAGLLLLLGYVVRGVWTEDVERARDTIDQTITATEPLKVDRFRPMRWVLTIGLALIGGWLAVQAAETIGTSKRQLSPGVVAVTLLPAMATLPAVGIATLLARTSRVGVAVTTQAATAMTLLTVVLPLTVAGWTAGQYGRKFLSQLSTSESTVATQSVSPFVHEVDYTMTAMPFGVGLWRIETLLLVALSLPLIPLANGRWLPGRSEGVSLLVGYVFYMMIVVLMGDRWH